jgi:diadenosine tetraphosphate (Ap4A) HIT family hydrolase
MRMTTIFFYYFIVVISQLYTTITGEQEEKFMFGKLKIEPDHVFHKSPNGLTYALVNLRPLVPGHVLVVPTRVVPRLKS